MQADEEKLKRYENHFEGELENRIGEILRQREEMSYQIQQINETILEREREIEKLEIKIDAQKKELEKELKEKKALLKKLDTAEFGQEKL